METKKPRVDKPTPSKDEANSERQQRLADSLRSNLSKRKIQARSRKQKS